MFPVERHNLILSLLDEHTSMTVDSLAALLGTTCATIRRDLEKLDKDGALTRTHGGAVKQSSIDPPFALRDSVMENEKAKIAQLCCKMINDGDTMFFDSSTTVMRLIPLLAGKKDITVITNGIKTSYELGKIGVNTICCGGQVTNSNTLVGIEAITSVMRYRVDKFFFSCRAFNDTCAYDGTTQNIEIKQAMYERANESILLCDSSKLYRTSLVKLDLKRGLKCVVTDKKPIKDLGVDTVF